MQNSFPLPFSVPGTRLVVVGTRTRSRGAWLLSPVAMVVVGFLLRLLAAALYRSYWISPDVDHFGFGYEMGRVARAIAAGHGFSSPFQGETGPTAWLAPLYPALVAGVFRMFGVYTMASAWVVLAINGFFSAMTCWTIYAIAKRITGIGVARWAGWIWALLPHAMYWSSRWIWETSMATFLLTLALLLALRIASEARTRDWILFGVTWGLIALTNPSCLTLLPVFGIWAAYRSWHAREPWLRGAAVAAVLFLAMLAPWTYRNYEVFHQFVPVRDNFGVEFWLGNADYSEGLWMLWLHPSTNEIEMSKYTQLGELQYVRAKRLETVDFVRRHPARFAELCGRRLAWFWVGVPHSSEKPLFAEFRNSSIVLLSVLAWWGAWFMVRRRRAGAWLILLSMAVYPLVYSLTFVDARYRHPIEPFMIIAGTYLLSIAMPRRLSVVKPRSSRDIAESQPAAA